MEQIYKRVRLVVCIRKWLYTKLTYYSKAAICLLRCVLLEWWWSLQRCFAHFVAAKLLAGLLVTIAGCLNPTFTVG